MATPPLRVAVYSPQRIVHEGIRSLLAKHPADVVVVPMPTSDAHEDPDVVLYDALALLDGDTAPLRFLVERTHSKVLAAGRDLRPDLLNEALDTGVDGFFSLGVDEAELLAAVASAGTGWEEGDAGEDPTVGSATSPERAEAVGGRAGLTGRETEVLRLIASGVSNVEIGATLFLSINSVKTHIRTAYRKIGVRNRANAVAWAIAHGYGDR